VSGFASTGSLAPARGSFGDCLSRLRISCHPPHGNGAPKAYERPWVALDKLQFVTIPDTVDLIEMMNAATEIQAVAAADRAEREGERKTPPVR
jgi:hypothetical protein